MKYILTRFSSDNFTDQIGKPNNLEYVKGIN